MSSDHHLLMTTVRLCLKKFTTANSTRTKYNVGLLRDKDTQAALQNSLSNRFQPLQELIEDNETDIETQWKHYKKLWHDTCQEVPGKKKTQHKEWISADTIHKLETRRERKTVPNNSRTRAAKAGAQEEYTAVNREVKRSIKKDKRDYIDDLARQAETAAGQGNMKDLYLVTKKLTGKFQQTDKPVMDKNGNPLTTTNEQLKRWAEHFRELLNHPTPDSPLDVPPTETELPTSCDKPSKEEIKKAIMTPRSGKAAGPDEIPAEAIKADIETAVNILYSLFSKIREKEEVPAHWKEGTIIKLPKKETLGTAATIEGSCSCQRQARFSTGFFTSLHLSLSLVDRWGTKDDRATTVLHSSLFSAFRRASPNFNPVHSVTLSSHLFFCLPLLLPPCTVPCRIIFASPVDLVLCPYHLSLRFFTVVRRSS